MFFFSSLFLVVDSTRTTSRTTRTTGRITRTTLRVVLVVLGVVLVVLGVVLVVLVVLEVVLELSTTRQSDNYTKDIVKPSQNQPKTCPKTIALTRQEMVSVGPLGSSKSRAKLNNVHVRVVHEHHLLRLPESARAPAAWRLCPRLPVVSCVSE